MRIPEFDLVGLLRTVFLPKPGERAGIFIDLPNPKDVCDWAFLKQPGLVTQHIAHDIFCQGLVSNRTELPFSGVEFYAYEPTGGSNLDLPATVFAPDGRTFGLVGEVSPRLDIVL